MFIIRALKLTQLNARKLHEHPTSTHWTRERSENCVTVTGNSRVITTCVLPTPCEQLARRGARFPFKHFVIYRVVCSRAVTLHTCTQDSRKVCWKCLHFPVLFCVKPTGSWTRPILSLLVSFLVTWMTIRNYVTSYIKHVSWHEFYWCLMFWTSTLVGVNIF